MPLDMQTALNQYGFVASLANSNPELKAKFDQAVREEWDSARFERELHDTNWYKSLSERRRQVEVQKATDPATWTATLANKAGQVASLAGRLGLYGVGAHYWAEQALINEWDDATLQAVLVDMHRPREDAGGLTGQSGEAEAHIRETWENYGLSVSDDTVKMWTREVLAGRTTMGGLDNQARSQAKKLYPAFVDQLESGMTMRDIADPYMQTMANTLEVNSASLALKDPAIKRALQGRDGQPMAMWEFERQLKDDARWQFTKQAKNETYATLQQVGQDWGFL